MAKTYPWGGFANGLIPDVFLTKVRGEWFEKEAAAHLVQLEQAFTLHFGYPAIILQGYRALGKPSDPPDAITQWGLYNKYRLTDPLRAAYPGTSPHGYARSADFASGVDQYGSQEKDWMNANAPAFGWHPTGDSFPRKEAWHFDYIPGTADDARAATLLEVPMAFKDTLEIFQSDRGYFVAGPGFVYDVGDKDGATGPEKLAALGKIGVPTTKVDVGTYDILRIVLRGNDLTQGLAIPLAAVHAAVTQPVPRDGQNISQAQDNMNTGTLVRNIAKTGVPVDAAAVATAVVAALPVQASPDQPTVTVDQVTAAVTAVMTEKLGTLTLKATS